ncbi:hypothetical protein HN385_07620 [archaeon]|jgi:hypothetical protein|nr:hypothetical protein [archaeon]MBT4207430.1 hypothetical protein [Candidatus Woesearchaeota archaeon]MBT5758854.1 hypothetical protein [Candidatus Neomarinimicrobiota bacterium]
MKYIWIVLLSTVLFGQQTFTDEQVVAIANQIKELQYSDSTKSVQLGIYEELLVGYNEQAKTDSTLLLKKDEQIGLLEERNDLLEKQVKLSKPSWYENKWLYFTYGAASIIIPTYFGIKIVEVAK